MNRQGFPYFRPWNFGLTRCLTFGVHSTEPRYRLPLQLEIKSLDTRAVAFRQKFTVELLVRNSSAEPFLVPVARNDGTVHEAGNKGRRSFSFGLRFAGALGVKPLKQSAEVTWSSISRPDSFMTVEPGETILVRLTGQLPDALANAPPSPPELVLKVTCDEWTSEDSTYFIRARSEEVESKNQVAVTVLPQ